jgi:hypothetical protein
MDPASFTHNDLRETLSLSFALNGANICSPWGVNAL